MNILKEYNISRFTLVECLFGCDDPWVVRSAAKFCAEYLEECYTELKSAGHPHPSEVFIDKSF